MDSRPPLARWLALAAFLALLASAALTTWSILTDRADFGAEAKRLTATHSNGVVEQPARGDR